MKLKLSPIFVFFGLFIIEGLSPNSASAASNKRILILHSYHQGFHWTDRIALRKCNLWDSCYTSIGISELAETDKTMESLIARADKAIYRAKNSGRNQVANY